MYLFIYLFIYSFVHLFIYLSIYLFIYLLCIYCIYFLLYCIYLFVYLCFLIYLFITIYYLFIYYSDLFIYKSISKSIYVDVYLYQKTYNIYIYDFPRSCRLMNAQIAHFLFFTTYLQIKSSQVAAAAKSTKTVKSEDCKEPSEHMQLPSTKTVKSEDCKEPSEHMQLPSSQPGGARASESVVGPKSYQPIQSKVIEA